MKYYFDESGNWENLKEREPRSLVMCAVFFPETSAYEEIKWAFQAMQADRSLTPRDFHATSLDASMRERVYAVMDTALTSGKAKVCALKFDPLHLKKTRRNETDLYIECASELLAKMVFPDSNPEIYSDMKFRGAYPAAVAKLAVNPSFRTDQKTFDRIMTTYQPLEETRDEKTRSVRTRLENALKKKPSSELNVLKEILDAESDPDVVKRYEFAELWLDWNERENVREKYRERILDKLRASSRTLGMNIETPKISMYFVDKNKNNAGIQFADFICNIIYKNSPTPRFSMLSKRNLKTAYYEKVLHK